MTSLGLAVGQRWHTRDEDTVTVHSHCPGAVFCWVLSNGAAVDDCGRWRQDAETEFDLVERIDEPSAPATLPPDELAALDAFALALWTQGKSAESAYRSAVHAIRVRRTVVAELAEAAP